MFTLTGSAHLSRHAGPAALFADAGIVQVKAAGAVMMAERLPPGVFRPIKKGLAGLKTGMKQPDALVGTPAINGLE